MLTRWRWVIAIGVGALIFLVFWSSRKPPGPTLHEISWQPPRPIVHMVVCDLDWDGNQEVVVNTSLIGKRTILNSKWWWLRPSLDGWKAMKVPEEVYKIYGYSRYPHIHLGLLEGGALYLLSLTETVVLN